MGDAGKHIAGGLAIAGGVGLSAMGMPMVGIPLLMGGIGTETGGAIGGDKGAMTGGITGFGLGTGLGGLGASGGLGSFGSMLGFGAPSASSIGSIAGMNPAMARTALQAGPGANAANVPGMMGASSNPQLGLMQMGNQLLQSFKPPMNQPQQQIPIPPQMARPAMPMPQQPIGDVASSPESSVGPIAAYANFIKRFA